MVATEVRAPPVGSRTSASLWADSKAKAAEALQHPFVAAIGKGDLPEPLFKAYIAQDIFYLRVFAEAYKIAIQKAVAFPKHVQDVLNELLAGVDFELRNMHKDYEQELHVTSKDTEDPNKATKDYTEFLQHVAKEQGVPRILAAMTPCNRLYAYLGNQLNATHPKHDHKYSAWIATYSGKEFNAICQKVEDLLDEISSHEDFEDLAELYRQAMQLEVDFFDQHNPEKN